MADRSVSPLFGAPGASLTITDHEAAALARTTVNLARVWKLHDTEARQLLGGLASDRWSDWKNGQFGVIEHDLRLRMSLLMGIHKCLRLIFSDPKRGYAWIRKANTAFAGASALDVMLRGETADLMTVREFLERQVDL